MKSFLLLISIFLFLEYTYSQTYRLRVNWNGYYRCSGGAYYSEFFHSTTIYDKNGNVLDKINSGAEVIRTYYTNTFNVRPYRVTHEFDCQILEGPYTGYKQFGELIIPQDGNCTGNTGQYLDVELFVPSELLNSPIASLCPMDVALLQVNNDCHNFVYDWFYFLNPTDAPIALNIQTTGNNLEQVDLGTILAAGYTGNIYFKAKIEDDFTNTIVYNIISCSPNLIGGPEPTNETCHGANDGSVTLTFDGNVDSAAGYEMRYFVYQGSPPTDPTTEQLLADPPVFPNQTFADPLGVTMVPLNDGSGNYSGTFTGLDGSSTMDNGNIVFDHADYYIIYQEVLYYPNGIDVMVKSGEVTPSFRIERPAEVEISIDQIIQPNCSGETGSVTVIGIGGGFPSEGNIPLEYSIRNLSDPNTNTPVLWQSENIFNGLIPGNYEFFTRSDTDCISQSSGTITINGPPLFDFDLENTRISQQPFPADNNGEIEVQIHGGFGNVLLELLDNNLPPTILQTAELTYTNRQHAFKELVKGSYYVRATDTNSCLITAPSNYVLQPEPLPLLEDPITTPVSCYNGSDGTVSVALTGNIDPYQYRILNASSEVMASGSGSASPISLNSLIPGNYSIEVIYNTGDYDTPSTVSSKTFSIANTNPLTITLIDIMGLSCNAFNDGYIEIQTSETGSYEYTHRSLNNWLALDPSGRIPISQAGFYNNLQIRKTLSPDRLDECSSNELDGIFVPEGLTILNMEINNNAIFIEVTGGNNGIDPLYTFEWTAILTNGDSYNNTSKNIENPVPGEYRLKVTDEKGCQITMGPIHIDAPDPLLLKIDNIVHISCYSETNGSITTTVQGGTPPYTYEWYQLINGNYKILAGNSEIMDMLPKGNYFAKVTDVNGVSTDSDTIRIDQPNELEIMIIEVTDIRCDGDLGTITVSASGGTGPYSYLWNNGSTSQNLIDAESGEYTVEVYDDNGCSAETTVTINPLANMMQVSHATLKNVSEYLMNDGSISLQMEGGIAPYTIDWIRLSDHLPIGNSLEITGLLAGSYKATISDSKGCSLTAIYKIDQPDIVEEIIISPSCAGDSNGSITILVNQGNGNYTYYWNTGETTDYITNLSPGSYTVTINGFGEGSLTRTYTVESPLPLMIDLGEDRTICSGQELVLDIGNGDSALTYHWTSDTGFSSYDSKISINEGGNYTVLVSDQNGCSATAAILITPSNVEVNAEFAVSSQVFVGEPFIVVDISYPLPETHEWILPESATVIKQDPDEAELVFDKPGEYEIGILTGIGECSAQQTKKILVMEKETPTTGEGQKGSKKHIKDFLLYPNPTDGKFTADITLSEKGDIRIRVYNFANNALMASKSAKGEMLYSMPLDISGWPSGIYAVILETPYGNALGKIILK